MNPSRPTLRTIAARLGVTAMTVSLALRNHSRVSAATKEKVRAMATELGYRPDPTVTKLMQHLRVRRSRRLQASICGLVDQWPAELSQRHRYTERVLRGLRERADELGYAFECLTLEDRTKAARMEKILVNRGIEGLVLLPRVTPTDMGDWLDWNRFSVLCVTSSVTAPVFHTVVPHHFENMMLACHKLVERRCRSVGLVLSKAWAARVRHRWTAAITWQNAFGGTRPIPPFFGESTDLQGDIPELKRWLREQHPHALVVDEISVTTVNQLVKSLPAARRPEVVRLSSDGQPAEAGIDQRSEQIGRAALDLLAGMIVHGDRGAPATAHMTLVSGDWVEPPGPALRGRALPGRSPPRARK